MTGFDLTIVLLNMVCAIAACCCNLWAAFHGPLPMRALRVGIGAYAAIYVIAYAWLAVFEDVAAWSKTMRGIGLGAWVMVWCGPAVMGVRSVRRIIHDIEQMDPER
jgi:hypothetical protein